MSVSSKSERFAAERERILGAYADRQKQVDAECYAPWQAVELLYTSGKLRHAARLLHQAGSFPTLNGKVLEVGVGKIGWLGVMIHWGVAEVNLCGIDLSAERVLQAQRVLPMADLRVGDATELPWDDERFDLVIASTVFTSILDSQVRSAVAEEIMRVMVPGGALLWYDFAVNNPSNPNVCGVRRADVRRLFPQLQGTIQSLTLAPPLARRIAPLSWTLATVLEFIPWLRTHLLGVLKKPN